MSEVLPMWYSTSCKAPQRWLREATCSGPLGASRAFPTFVAGRLGLASAHIGA